MAGMVTTASCVAPIPAVGGSLSPESGSGSAQAASGADADAASAEGQGDAAPTGQQISESGVRSGSLAYCMRTGLRSKEAAAAGEPELLAAPAEGAKENSAADPTEDTADQPMADAEVCSTGASTTAANEAGFGSQVQVVGERAGMARTASRLAPVPAAGDSKSPGASALVPTKEAARSSASESLSKEGKHPGVGLAEGNSDQSVPDGDIQATDSSAAADAALKAAATVQDAVIQDNLTFPVRNSSPPGQDGMSDALREGTMQAAMQMNENSPPAEQKLPVGAVLGGVLPAVERTRKLGTAEADAAGVESGNAGVMSVGAKLEGNGHLEGNATDSVEGSPNTSAIEAVHRALNTATRGLEQTGTGSLMVVLKPDTQTQLALHVKWEQDHYEATAVVERGDFAALGAEWTHLQKRLADQGVSLAPLISATEYARTGGGESTSEREGTTRQREHPGSGEPAERTAPATRARQSVARPVSAIQGREWWA